MFNCSVPGTLYDIIEECNITTMVKTPSETTSVVTVVVPTTVTSTSVHIPTNSPPTHTSFGIPLLASLISDVVMAVILVISITIICVIIRFKVGRNGQPNTKIPGKLSLAYNHINDVSMHMWPKFMLTRS